VPPAEGEVRSLMAELSRINSELATQQRATARAQADAATRGERVEQYVGMVAHDLANPVQVVLGLAELILEDPTLDSTQHDRVARILRSAELMRSLVADLAGGFLDEEESLELVRFDLRELVASVVARHQILAARKHLEIALEVRCDGDGCQVDGDVVELERAVDNLLGNAVKFSPPGGRVEVSLRQEERGGTPWTVVDITDHGPGIDPAGHEAIFEMFHREEATADAPGVGLGLYITRQIVERHQGSVAVRSQPGHGSSFELALPLPA
jgi:signal transduction histidine kinase